MHWIAGRHTAFALILIGAAASITLAELRGPSGCGQPCRWRR